ncbi:MAG: GTPase domain-containing protein [Verrucomicrobiota bacterium]
MAPDRIHQQNIILAEGMESSLAALGDTSSWEAYPELVEKCRVFREASKEISGQRGFSDSVVAFLGPKNAGKTTLLSCFVREGAVKEQLNPGASIRQATEKIIWVGSAPPSEMDRRVEEVLELPNGGLVDLGFPYTLVDVPGSNERELLRSEAAKRALHTAHLKVLVIDRRSLEDAGVLEYAREADGACVLPVVNQIRSTEDDESDYTRFETRLKEALPGSTVLPLLRVPDFLLEAEEKRKALVERTTLKLQETVAEILKQHSPRELLEPQLARLQKRFREDVREILTRALPATSAAVREVQETEEGLAIKALEHLLGSEEDQREIMVGLRQQLRGVFLQRTSLLLFPWRTFLGLANLLHGAMEKVPFLLMGSLPSLLTTSLTAVKNAVRDREMNAAKESALQEHAEMLVKESLQPQVEHLEAALRSDLRAPSGAARKASAFEVHFDGLDNLQRRSSGLFADVLGRHAPGAKAATVCGVIGCLIFWAIFSWPMIALYRDYFSAAGEVFGEGPQITKRFPQQSVSMLMTSFLLAVLPMFFFLLLVLSWVGSRSRAAACLAELREKHHGIIKELSRKNLLRIRTEHSRLGACLKLFQTAEVKE